MVVFNSDFRCARKAPREIGYEWEYSGIVDGMAIMYDEEKELPFVVHEPNECKCTNELKQHVRNGKKVWLCSCCNLSTDEEV